VINQQNKGMVERFCQKCGAVNTRTTITRASLFSKFAVVKHMSICEQQNGLLEETVRCRLSASFSSALSQNVLLDCSVRNVQYRIIAKLMTRSSRSFRNFRGSVASDVPWFRPVIFVTTIIQLENRWLGCFNFDAGSCLPSNLVTMLQCSVQVFGVFLFRSWCSW
jgi:hypothetical protein